MSHPGRRWRSDRVRYRRPRCGRPDRWRQAHHRRCRKSRWRTSWNCPSDPSRTTGIRPQKRRCFQRLPSMPVMSVRRLATRSCSSARHVVAAAERLAARMAAASSAAIRTSRSVVLRVNNLLGAGPRGSGRDGAGEGPGIDRHGGAVEIALVRGHELGFEPVLVTHGRGPPAIAPGRGRGESERRKRTSR